MGYKITVYLRSGGTEVFNHATYREHLGSLYVEWYTRVGGNKNRRVFGPNQYFSYEVENIY